MQAKTTRMTPKTEEFASLTAFTALEPLVVGGLVGLLVARGPTTARGFDWAALTIWISGLLALGISLLHLGRPWRAPLALVHLSTSWLSREVFLFALFMVTLLTYMILPIFSPGSVAIFVIGLISAIFGLAATIATGQTYRLHARPSWDQWLTIFTFPIGALSTGLLFGYFVAHIFTTEQVISNPVWWLATMMLILAAGISCVRTISQHSDDPEASLSRTVALDNYSWLLVLRVITILISIIFIWMGGEVSYLAWAPALLGEFADRILFFNTAVPVTVKGRYI